MNAEQFKELSDRLERSKALHSRIFKLQQAVNQDAVDLGAYLKLSISEDGPSGICVYIEIDRAGKSKELANAILPVLQRWLDEAKAELESL